MTQILVAAGVRFYREGMADVLRRQPEFEVVGTVATLREVVAALQKLPPDVLLLDATFEASLRAVPQIRAQAPATRVVALAVEDAEPDVIAWAEAGVSSLITRDASIDDVLETIRAVMAGEAVCSRRMVATLLRRVRHLAQERQPAPGHGKLTRRELEVASLIEEGLSNKEIAARLTIGLPTVKNHIHSILDKLDVSRRGEAVARLRQMRYDPPAIPPREALGRR